MAETLSDRLRCPVDGAPMYRRRFGEIELDGCPRCGGIWFDGGELDQVVEAAFRAPEQVAQLDRKAGAQVQEHGFSRTLSCPRCGVQMSPGRYAGGIASVELDRCSNCGGAWADGGEVSALVEELCRPQAGSMRALGEAIARASRERETWRELAAVSKDASRRVSLADLFLPKIVLPLGVKAPVERFPLVTVLLALFCIAVFAMQVAFAQPTREFFSTWGLVPSRVLSGKSLWTFLTHMFVHGGLLHLLGNLAFLWLFARAVESTVGRLRFFFCYMLCGILAGAAYIAGGTASGVPAVGASGAISGVMGMFLVLHPRARIPTLFIRHVIDIPAWLYLTGWVGLQFLTYMVLTSAGACSCIAYSAHLGGFFAGVA
ncbi:MAG: rhomboid family intramembrane serine protease, partial [Deltaproteobacteria bacterium]